MAYVGRDVQIVNSPLASRSATAHTHMAKEDLSSNSSISSSTAYSPLHLCSAPALSSSLSLCSLSLSALSALCSLSLSLISHTCERIPDVIVNFARQVILCEPPNWCMANLAKFTNVRPSNVCASSEAPPFSHNSPNGGGGD